MDEVTNRNPGGAAAVPAGDPPVQEAPAVKGVEAAAPEQNAFLLVTGQSGGLTAGQIGSLTAVHEVFARNLAHNLSSHLRTPFQVSLVSTDQVPFSQISQQFTESSYLARLDVQPFDATIFLELDGPMAFTIIDLLGGGTGKGDPPARVLTEIENIIMESGMEMISGDLRAAWKEQMDLRFTLTEPLNRSKIAKLLPGHERVVAVNFELEALERRGTLTFVLPSLVSTALARVLDNKLVPGRHPSSPDFIAARRQRVLGCTFDLELRLPETPVSLQALLQLEPGQVLNLEHRVDEPALLMIGDQKLFTARPVRAQNLRGALIDTNLMITASDTREMK
jgi:flagellar motor switch protein FliM